MTCWAYNRDGHRCDLDHDHDDNHEYVVKWTNEENWTPATPGNPAVFDDIALTSTAGQIAAAEALWDRRNETVDTEALALVGVTPSLGPCVACSHMHASGQCRCGCETYIP